MADKSKPLVIDDISGGRDGFDPPWAVARNQCVDAVNTDFYGTRFARKRGGMATVATTFSAGGPFTEVISSLFRHVPGTDQSLAELWAIDNAATNVVGRMAGGTSFAAPTLKDNPTGNGYDWTAVTVNGLLSLAYKSAVARHHVWDGSTVRRAGLAATNAPTAANTGAGGSIAFDAVSTLVYAGGTTFSHTCAVGATVLFVWARADTAAVTAVTYNGVAMTQITTVAGGGNYYLYYLVSPTSGAHNVVITSVSNVGGFGVSYTGTAITSIPDGSGTTGPTAANSVSIGTTTTLDGDWVIFCAEDRSGVVPTANTNTTLRVNDATNSASIFDSNSGVSPPGLLTQTAGVTIGSNATAMSAAFPSAAPAVAPIIRYYRERSTVQSGGVTIRRSEPSASVAFTPSGSGSAVRITQATPINEGETHYEVEASVDNVTFYRIATVAIGTTTYDDSAATSSYANNPLSALTGTYTLQKPYKFVGGDQNRHLGLGSWTSTDKQSRLEISAVVGSLDIGDAERVDTTTNYFIDFDENDSGVPTGIAGPALGAYYVFKDRRSYLLTPTGVTSNPFRVDSISKRIGAVNQAAIALGEDSGGNGAIYWMSHRGPYRWGVNGLEYLGRAVEDFVRGRVATANGTVLNLSASKAVARCVYYEDLRQVWFWWATSAVGASAADPNQCFKFDILSGGWTRVPSSDNAANVRCAVMFSNTLGAAMSLDLKPYVGETGAVNTLSKAETGTDDHGTAFRAYVITRDEEPGGPGAAGNLGDVWLLAVAAPGVTVTDVVTSDFNSQNTESGTASLTPTGVETRVLRRMGTSFRGGSFFHHEIGDAAPVSNTWTIERLVIGLGKDQQRAP